VIDESGRSVIVFDGRLRFGRINPEEGLREQRSSKSLLIAPVHLRALL
jgi:hypothetical protein